MPGQNYTGRIPAKGTQLWNNREATTGVFTRMAGLRSIDGPNMTRETVDATELDPAPTTLPGGRTEESYYFKTKLPGTKDVQGITCELNMSQAQYTILLEMYVEDEIFTIEIRLRNGAKLAFVCYVESLPLNLTENQLAQIPVVFMPVNGVTWTEA